MTGLVPLGLAAGLALAGLAVSSPAVSGPVDAVSSGSAGARPPTLQDMLQMSEVEGAGLSPSGRYAVVSYAGPYDRAGVYDGDLSVQAARARLLVVDTVSGVRRTHPVLPGPFSPDGRRMAVLRLQRSGLQVGRLELRSGRVRWLRMRAGAGGLGRSLQWRGDTLLALEPGGAATGSQSGRAVAARVNQLWVRQGEGRRASATQLSTDAPAEADARLVEADATGAVRLLARGALLDVEVSPQSSWAALLEAGGPKPLEVTPRLHVADRYRQVRLRLTDLVTGGEMHPCPGVDLLPTVLTWSPSGRRLAVVGRPPDASGWEAASVYLVDPQAATCLRLRPPPWPLVRRVQSDDIPVAAVAWSGEQPIVAGTAPNGSQPAWVRLDVQAAPKAAATPRPPSDEAFSGAFRPQAGRVDLGERADSLAGDGTETRITVRREPEGDSVVQLVGPAGTQALLTLNAALRSRSWSIPVAIAGKPGAAPHWLYPPNPARPGTRAPLVVLPYPGSASQTPPQRYAPGAPGLVTQAQLLAAHGYAVLVPSLPRPADAGWTGRPWPDAVAAQIAEAIALAGRRPEVDPTRVAVWGHSFGGLAALLSAEKLTGLSGVVAEMAPSDLAAMRGALPLASRAFSDPEPALQLFSGWSEAGQGDLGGSPWEVADRYRAASPLFAADRVACPVLLISGERDFITPGQGEAMFAALRRLDKPAKLVTFWGEGHVLLSPANIALEYDRAFAFLDRAFLKRVAGPAQTPSGGSTPPMSRGP